MVVKVVTLETNRVIRKFEGVTNVTMAEGSPLMLLETPTGNVLLNLSPKHYVVYS